MPLHTHNVRHGSSPELVLWRFLGGQHYDSVEKYFGPDAAKGRHRSPYNRLYPIHLFIGLILLAHAPTVKLGCFLDLMTHSKKLASFKG